MTEYNKKENSIIPISSTDLVRVGNSIEIVNKIIKEHEQRIVIRKFDTVKIGNQEWMVKNLDVDRYRNGDPIPMVTNDEEWNSLTTGAYCYFNNDPTNGKKYGKLYNWYAVNDPRGLAPAGWHIPGDKEWTELTDCLGGREVAGGKMKETGTFHWKSPNEADTNSSGWAGLPGGGRHGNGFFGDVGSFGYWWSATEDSTANAWLRYLVYNDGTIFRYDNDKQGGFSVRCLRD